MWCASARRGSAFHSLSLGRMLIKAQICAKYSCTPWNSTLRTEWESKKPYNYEDRLAREQYQLSPGSWWVFTVSSQKQHACRKRETGTRNSLSPLFPPKCCSFHSLQKRSGHCGLSVEAAKDQASQSLYSWRTYTPPHTTEQQHSRSAGPQRLNP